MCVHGKRRTDYPDTGESGESYDLELGHLRGEEGGKTESENDEDSSLPQLRDPL